MRIIQTRLALALSNLPNQATQASIDLETAWNEIDKLLIIATFPEEEATIILSTIPTNEGILEEEAETPTEEESTDSEDDN